MKLVNNSNLHWSEQTVTVEMTLAEVAALYAYVGNTIKNNLIEQMKSEKQFEDEEVTKKVIESIKNSYLFEELQEVLELNGIEC